MKKTLKKRTFISAIAMLIVSAIVLTSSTFAWFSMARQVEVEKMQLTVTSPEGIQISANTNAWTTQLSYNDVNPTEDTVSRFKADSDHTNHFPALLAPSSSRLATAGRLPTFFQGAVSEDGTLTATQVNDANGGYVVFDVFLKVSEAQTVYWDKTTVAAVANGNTEVVNSARVALIPCGTSEDPATAKTVLTCAQGDAQLFEPAGYSHNEEVVAAGVISNDEYVKTLYLNNTIAASEKINVAGSGYVTDNPYKVFETYAKTLADEKNTDGMKLSLLPGITRVRVYMWMEGNDVDCLQSVGGSQFDFNLVFSLDK